MARAIAADVVSGTPLAAADTAQALVRDIVPALRDLKLRLEDLRETAVTLLVVSQQLKRKYSKLAFVINSSL